MKHYEYTNDLYTIRQLIFLAFFWYFICKNWETGRRENLNWNNHIHLLVVAMSHRFLYWQGAFQRRRKPEYRSNFKYRLKFKAKKRWLIGITSKWIWLFQLRFSLLLFTQFWRARYLMKAKNVSCLMVYKLFVCSWCFIS